VRKLRLERRLSQEALAAEARLHRTYVGGIERGERNPSFSNILRLCDALDVKFSELALTFEAERDAVIG
jgi:transcriptional regulator with XRE-family HTH domain